VTDHLYRAETNTGRASLAGYGFALLGDAALLTDYPDAVEAVTGDEVRRMLDLLTDDRASFYVARPVGTASRE
jgi:predicted Zn-dependent peptidase